MPGPRLRPVRIVIEAMVPDDITEGEIINALPQPRWMRIQQGERSRNVTLRYRRWSAVVAPLAAVEAAAKALERAGAAFSITGTLHGALRQLKGY